IKRNASSSRKGKALSEQEREQELDKLAEEIRADLAELDELARKSAERSISIAAKLERAKELLERGEFEGWVKKHCGFGRRTAERHIRRGRRLKALKKPFATVLSQIAARCTMAEIDALLDFAKQQPLDVLRDTVSELDASGSELRAALDAVLNRRKRGDAEQAADGQGAQSG